MPEEESGKLSNTNNKEVGDSDSEGTNNDTTEGLSNINTKERDNKKKTTRRAGDGNPALPPLVFY